MNITDNPNIEEAIALAAIETLSEAGISITRVGYDESGGVRFKQAPTVDRIMEEATATDSATLDTSTGSFVWLVWGNEHDVIADYSEDLESVLAPVLQQIEFLRPSLTAY